MREGDLKSCSDDWLAQPEVTMSAGSDPVKLTLNPGGTWLQFTVSWIDTCKGPPQNSHWPLGGAHAWSNSGFQIFYKDWRICKWSRFHVGDVLTGE